PPPPRSHATPARLPRGCAAQGSSATTPRRTRDAARGHRARAGARPRAPRLAAGARSAAAASRIGPGTYAGAESHGAAPREPRRAAARALVGAGEAFEPPAARPPAARTRVARAAHLGADRHRDPAAGAAEAQRRRRWRA